MKIKKIYLFFIFILLVVVNLILIQKYKLTRRLIEKVYSTQIKNPLSKFSNYKNTSTKIILAGDVMLGRTVMIKSLDLKDSSYPFRKVADRLNSADLVFANLENPFIADCPEMQTGLKFCSLPSMLDGLVYSGINIVSLANNHTKNFGENGYETTKYYLKQRGIDWTDDKNPVIKTVNKTNFGFLAFDLTVKNPTQADFNLVKESKAKTDILILGIHWGAEYSAKASEAQRTWAKKFIESGADVIAGHHSHWVQNIECIESSHGGKDNTHLGWYTLTPQDTLDNRCSRGSKIVYYSLGNFVFDQMWSEQTKKGIVVELTFAGKEIVEQKIDKIYMSSWAQPEFIE